MKVLATVLLGPGSEAAVGDAIRSLNDHVDGFVLIESGGAGPALRAAYEAAGKPAVTAHFDWVGDYGKARNFALEQARANGATHAVTLDPDERIVFPSDLRELIGKSPDAEALIMRDRDEGYFKERILNCSASLTWHGRVCEYLVGMTMPQVKIGGFFMELPKTEEGERRRWERGVIACERMIADGDDRYRWRRHLGSCLMGLGRVEEANTHYRAALELTDVPEERAWVRYLLAEQSVLAGNLEEATCDAANALAEHAGYLPEFGWIIGYCELQRGNHQNASRWAQLALNCPPDRTRVGFRGMRVKPGCQQILGYLHGQGAQERQDGNFTLADFQRRKSYAPNYKRLAAALAKTLEFQDHLDLGAGQGLLVEPLLALGVHSYGVELEESARVGLSAELASRIAFGVGASGWHKNTPRELVSCVEVLEHIPEAEAHAAIAAIAGCSKRWVYFSAAAPGQPGKGHINCQPKSYWREKFAAHGFRFAEAKTAELVDRIKDLQPCFWLPQNAQLFERNTNA